MTKEGSSKVLKEANRGKLWATMAANAAVLYGFSRYQSVATMGIEGLVAGVFNLVPLTLALILTTITNGLLSDKAKTRLVFLRWRQPLPGHRAFSTFALSDPRVDVDGLRTLLGKNWPTDPESENRTWYRLFKDVESDPAVLFAHGEYLFTRDYAGMATLFAIVLGGAAAVIVRPLPVLWIYLVGLVVQFLVARHVAANYGERFVCTVLARTAVRPVKSASTRGKLPPKAATTT